MPDRVSPARLERLAAVPPAFSGMLLDRAVTLRRDPSWVAEQLVAPASRAVAAGAVGVLVDGEAATVARRPHPAEGVPIGGEAATVARRPHPTEWTRDDEAILLGLEGSAAVFAIDIEALEPASAARLTQGGRIVGLREAGALLPHAESGLAAYAVALLNWHRKHRFCANCGAMTAVAEAGYSRQCPRCGAVHFPRTDPVVIMLVESEGHLLLGRRAEWPTGRYSALAGFISPGESAEEAVVREVREESGIHAYGPTFVTSQPWPFPSSLMLGFEARSDGGDPRARDGELEDVRWFGSDQVRAAALDGATDLALPPRLSIARFLIERWVARRDGDGQAARWRRAN